MTIPESADAPTLGMLMLTNRPLHLPGALSNPASHPYPVRFLEVPGAHTEVVVGDDTQIVGAYIDGARQLEHEAVAAITSNCGFTARFQPQVPQLQFALLNLTRSEKQVEYPLFLKLANRVARLLP